jgi:GT2 family glycosyltransferase
MLSICIPIYDYDVSNLVSDLYKQAIRLNQPFEILLIDDASDKSYQEKNRQINLKYVKYVELEKNIGRSAIRNKLANDAQYSYLIFMDCDSGVISDSYIENYARCCETHIIYCGGRVYSKDMPNDNTLLHWKYGTARECHTAAIRNKNPNYGFQTNNFLISKLLFETLQFNENLKGYGHEDTFFGIELQEKGITIKHIDNPLIHLGLENASVFLEKAKNAISNLIKIEHLIKEKYPKHAKHSNLMKTKFTLEKLHLVHLFSIIFKINSGLMKKHLLGNNPSLRIFDLYRLGLLCTKPTH